MKGNMELARKLVQEQFVAKGMNGIYSVLFMSPIFPKITDFKAIINNSKDYVDEYWFENLNLRGNYKQTILSYINVSR